MLLGLGIGWVSEIVGAFGERDCSEDFANCDAVGFGRACDGFDPGADSAWTSRITFLNWD
jgi:hypothetical protein